MFVATLIADGRLNESIVSQVVHSLRQDFKAGQITSVKWIDPGCAIDICFEPSMAFAANRSLEMADAIQDAAMAIGKDGHALDLSLDIIVQPMLGREKRLLVADMDSTMIGQECIDELADYAGIRPQVAAITERAMRGELDFAAALCERVALLRNLDQAIIAQCLQERVRQSPGAEVLVRTMRSRGATTLLVSGGFTAFAEPVAATIGFDRVEANVLEVSGGRLSGAVSGRVVDAEYKAIALLASCRDAGIEPRESLAIGDGANDRMMIEAAGLGVAYRAKPALAEVADARLDHHGLDALLWAQGIARDEWVRA